MTMRGLLIVLLFLGASPQAAPRFPVHVETPDYPLPALQARVDGDVEVFAEVDSQGRVVGTPFAAAGDPLLKQAAAENIRSWRFQPGAEERVKVTYHYMIEGTDMYGCGPTQYKFDLPDSVTVIALQGTEGGSLLLPHKSN